MLEGEGEAIGANVVVEGNETIGAVTEYDGTFSLEVPNGTTALIFSYTGYATQTVSIVEQSTLSITLGLDNKLKTVIVVGYGTQEKERVTGSVSVIDSKQIESVPLPSFDQAIQGRAAGVTVLSDSGQPGSSANVTIRGQNSIEGSSTPLYIMDGIQISPGDFAALNSNDIESFSVLKDASAASIYGSQAAGGVILITTKKGSEGPAKIKYSSQLGVSVRTQNPKLTYMTSEQLLKYQEIAGVGPGAEETQEVKDSLAQINTDWDGYIFKTGLMHSHNLSISGGSKVNSYYISASYLDQEGITPNSSYKRGSIRFNDQNKLNDNLTLGINLIGSYARSSEAEDENSVYVGNPFFAAQAGLPYQEPYDADGNYQPVGAFENLNFVEDFEKNTNLADDMKTVTSVNLEYQIPNVRGLSVKTTWGVDYSQTALRYVTPPTTIRGSTSTGLQGSATRRFSRIYRMTGSQVLSYDRFFGELHKVDFILGNEISKREFRNFTWTGAGLNDKIPNEFSAQDPTDGSPEFFPSIGARHTESRLNSFFSRGSYSYDDRYNFSASIRYDGSSRFGANNKWAPFWSAGASWVISQEEFLKNNDLVNYLKFSVSYGTIGNQDAIGDYQHRATFGITSYDGPDNGHTATSLGNPDLRWETSSALNIGLDFSVLKNRISGDVQVYNNVTSDLFVRTSLSYTTGFSQLEVNSGEIRNRGIEAIINVTLLQKDDFNWGINANGSYNKSKVLDLGNATEYVPGGANGITIIREGASVTSHYVADFAGVDPATGSPLYYDLEGNIVDQYSPDIRKIVGESAPPFSGGFGSDLTYKGIGFSAFFSFAAGHLILNNDRYFTQRPGFSGLLNMESEALTIWQQPGDITAYPGADFDSAYPDMLGSTRYYEDASFLRLRNVQLSYQLPSKMMGKTIKAVKIYGQAQNLYTITGYTGPDPENFNAVSTYLYPPPRIFTFGLDVTF